MVTLHQNSEATLAIFLSYKSDKSSIVSISDNSLGE